MMYWSLYLNGSLKFLKEQVELITTVKPRYMTTLGTGKFYSFFQVEHTVFIWY